MKHLDVAVIEIYELQIVELLKHEMTRIKQNTATGMVLHTIQKHLESCSVVQVFSRMDLET